MQEVKAAFNRYIGIDYSGAETCESRLKGLRVYMADRANEPHEVAPPRSPRWYWTREKIAHWLVERLSEQITTLVGIDHGFSFPLKYFEKYGPPHDWSAFLDDFQKHWSRRCHTITGAQRSDLSTPFSFGHTWRRN